MITIYLDTSVISAYFDDRYPDRRDKTRLFWQSSQGSLLVVSQLVFQEINRTPELARRNQMLSLVQGLHALDLNPAANKLANDFAVESLVPAKKFEDAQHLALAVVYGVDFLVSWNFKHMVNFNTMHRLPVLAAKNGYFKHLMIVSPESAINTLDGRTTTDELT